MKRLFFLLAIVFAFSTMNAQETFRFHNDHPQGFSIESSTATGLSLHYSVPEIGIATIDNGEARGQEIILKGSFGSFAEGLPNLPSENRYIAVPRGATVSIEVKEKGCQTLNGIEVLPAATAQGNSTVGLPKLHKDMSVFGKDAYFPTENVAIAQATQIRGLDVVMLSVTPFRYNPVRKTLEVIYDMDIEVRFEGGSGQFGEARYRNPEWDHILRDLVINNDMLPEAHYYDLLNEAIRNNEEGCEYLIISPDNDSILAWADTLKQFRTKQGILTKVVTTTECGGNEPETIKSYIQNAYENWAIPPAALMIFGGYQDTLYYQEELIVPGMGIPGFLLMFYHYDYGNGTIRDFSYLSDNPYADMNADSIPDMAISRLPAINPNEYQLQVKKLIHYETEPPTDTHYYDHPVITSGFEHNKWFMITSQSINGFFCNKLDKHPSNFYMFYESSVDPIPPDSVWSTGYNTSAPMDYFGPDGQNYFPRCICELDNWRYYRDNSYLVDALSSGTFLTVYRDHSANDCWCCPYFYCYEIPRLTNTVPTFLLSIGCDTGCFQEYIYASGGYSFPINDNLISNFCKEQTGALGGIGAATVTRSHFNDILTWGIMDYLWPEFMPTLGSTISPEFARPTYALLAGKLFLNQHAFMPDWWPGYINDSHNVFHSLGDAYLNLFTEVPQQMAIEAEPFSNGQSLYHMTAEEGATICLTRGDDILLVTQATGQPQDLALPNLPIGDHFVVTVTKQNRFRFELDVTVVSPDLPCVYVKDFQINEHDSNGQLDNGENIDFDIILRNNSQIASSNGEITLVCESPFVSVVQGTAYYPQIGAYGTYEIKHAFKVKVANNVPDQKAIPFKVRFNENENTHEDAFVVTANAPIITLSPEFRLMTADGEPSTHIVTEGKSTITFTVNNKGHATASHLCGTLSIKAPFVDVETAVYQYDSLRPNEELSLTYELNTTPNTISGAWLQSKLEVQHMGSCICLDTIVQYGCILEDFENETLNPFFKWTNSGSHKWEQCPEDAYDGQYCFISNAEPTIASTLRAQLKSEHVKHNCKVSFHYKTYANDTLVYRNTSNAIESHLSSQDWQYAEALYNGTDHNFVWSYKKYDTSDGQGKIDNICFPPLHTTIAYAGDDITVCSDAPVELTEAYAYDCNSVLWATEGDGHFEQDDIVNPIYLPGTQDIANGSVALTLSAFGKDTIVSSTTLHFKDEIVLDAIVGDSIVNIYQNAFSHYSIENQEGLPLLWQLEPVEAGSIYFYGNSIDIYWNPLDSEIEATLTVTAENGCEDTPVSRRISLVGYSIPEWNAPSFDLFPNPTDGKVHLIIGETLQGKAVVEVYNLLGERMMAKNIGSLQGCSAITLDLSHFVSGLYIIKLSAENGSCSKKVSVW